ncbi:MAG: tetratricopeptide repeat protein [Methylomonas sp.]
MSSQPYIGLRPFERNETDIFFGREQHSDELINRLGVNHFLAVIGNSGCGKSSLVKTGLIAGLEAGYLATTSTHWRIVEMRPGNHPFQELAEKLVIVLSDVLGPQLSTETLQQSLRKGSLSLHELLAQYPLPNNAQLLIVCDQFEEIFRYSKQGANYEAANFVSLLLASSKPYPISPRQVSDSIYVVMTMRSDFLGDCTQFAGLSDAINRGLYLTPRLDAQQLREAIEEPALVFDGVVAPELISQLLEDAENNSDQLPLLQHVLMRLWDLATDKTKTLDLEDYKKTGGLRSALSMHADEAYNALSDEQKNIAQAMFCLLTEHDPGKRDTRRPTALSEIMKLTDKSSAEVAAVIDVFRQPGRCFLMPPMDIDLTPAHVIDISHESLIRQWRRLKDWAKKEAEAAAVYKRLADNATRWRQGNAALLQSPDLEFASSWLIEFKPSAHWAERYADIVTTVPPETADEGGFDSDNPSSEGEATGALKPVLTPENPATDAKETSIASPTFDLVTDYIKQSQTAKQQQIEHEQQAQQRQLKQARLITTVSTVGLLIVLALAFGVWRESEHATGIEKQRTTELFQAHLIHASLLAKNEDYAEAKKILEQTYLLDKDIAAGSQYARNLLGGFSELKGGQAEQVYKDAEGARNPLHGVAVSPDGQLLAAAGEHGTLVIFDVQTGNLLQRIEGHATEKSVYSVVFTPMGKQLISGGMDKKILVWQRKDNHFTLQNTLPAPDEVSAIAISPDGGILASGGTDGDITLWELASGKAKATLSQHTRNIAENGLNFSANGDSLVSASYDGTAIIWQVATGKPLRIFTGHTGKVEEAAFTADGKMLVTASADKTLRLWDIATAQTIRVLTGHQNLVSSTRFLANSAYILSGSFDRTIRLWDSESGVTLRLWQGHEAGTMSLAIYANQLFSAGKDGAVRRWSLALPYQLSIDLHEELAANAISPDLRFIAVGFANGALRCYDMATGRILWQQQNAHKSDINQLVFNTEGNLLASGSSDHSAKIWRVFSPQQNARLDQEMVLQLEKTLTGKDAINTIAFSPNRQTIATGGNDGTIGLFELATEKQESIDAHTQCQGADCERKVVVSFNNDGSRLLSNGTSDRLTRLWNLPAGASPSLFAELPKANDELMWSSFSPDNQLISTVGRGGIVNVYSTQNNRLKYNLVGHESTVWKSIFAPDSLLLATVSADANVKLWNLDKRNELLNLRLPTIPYPPVPMWDFDFRCLKTCALAVPLTSGKLLLYQFPYADQLQFANDKAEQKRTSLALWQDYLALEGTLYRQKALPSALQAQREADIIGNPLMRAYPDDVAIQESAIRGFHQNAQLHTSLNQGPEALTAFENAMDLSEKSLKQNPDNQQLQKDSISIFIEYADLLKANQQPGKAAEIQRRLFALPLANVESLVIRAEFAYQAGNNEALERDLIQASEKVDKQNVGQLNQVGYDLANLTQHYPEAYQLLKQALALKPEDAGILDNMGWAAYKMGNNQEALDYLQKSHAKASDMTEVNAAGNIAHLGEVLWATGKQKQATELFNKASHDYPDNELVKKASKQFAPGLSKK